VEGSRGARANGGGKRERERETQRERHREKERETQRERERDTEIEREQGTGESVCVGEFKDAWVCLCVPLIRVHRPACVRVRRACRMATRSRGQALTHK